MKCLAKAPAYVATTVDGQCGGQVGFSIATAFPLQSIALPIACQV